MIFSGVSLKVSAFVAPVTKHQTSSNQADRSLLRSKRLFEAVPSNLTLKKHAGHTKYSCDIPEHFCTPFLPSRCQKTALATADSLEVQLMASMTLGSAATATTARIAIHLGSPFSVQCDLRLAGSGSFIFRIFQPAIGTCKFLDTE